MVSIFMLIFVDFCSQEYVLLNSDYVLPEFLMHVQFKKEERSENKAAIDRVKRSLVNMPAACIQRSHTTAQSDPYYAVSSSDKKHLQQTSSRSSEIGRDNSDGSERDDIMGNLRRRKFGWSHNSSPSRHTINTTCNPTATSPLYQKYSTWNPELAENSLQQQAIPFIPRNGCAEVFSDNIMASLTNSGIQVPSDIQDITNVMPSSSDSYNDQTLLVQQLAEIEKLASSLTAFDSRQALVTKQEIVRGIEESVEIFTSKRKRLLRSIFKPSI